MIVGMVVIAFGAGNVLMSVASGAGTIGAGAGGAGGTGKGIGAKIGAGAGGSGGNLSGTLKPCICDICHIITHTRVKIDDCDDW